MQLEKIISISGKPGLYKLISQLKSGFIVEDVLTKKKASISNSSQVSLLTGWAPRKVILSPSSYGQQVL